MRKKPQLFKIYMKKSQNVRCYLTPYMMTFRLLVDRRQLPALIVSCVSCRIVGKLIFASGCGLRSAYNQLLGVSLPGGVIYLYPAQAFVIRHTVMLNTIASHHQRRSNTTTNNNNNGNLYSAVSAMW